MEPIVRDAVVFASLLSLLSIGLTLTYLTTKVPNFSHGSLATIGVFTVLTTTELWRQNPYISVPLAFVLSGMASLFLYLAALRPLISRGAGLPLQMVATLAYELILLAVLNIYADFLTRVFKITSRDFLLRKYDLKILDEPGVFIISPLLVIFLVSSLYLLLTRTKFGVAMRAAIENAPLAGVIGINVRTVYMFSWFLAGGLAGVAGAMMGLWFQADPGFGSRMLVSIFSASIVGGLQNIYGGAVGGYIVGLAEILGTSQLASVFGVQILPYRPLIPLSAMIITLLLFPKGFSGMDWGRIIRLRLQGAKL
ncbi:MAG: branched-chain amino acid ABC transporter permease [Candidatus Caldarchaeum sp.]|nr:branched-chain amino acid ABC transporter permease [Candidatus Caldarchaeum sp.]MDW7977534.1 branched-chain amino acid ABC transporter permease [Candidatus Caldarchaeum sp.]MDW8360172.1 branched-chain amino acid ABC transporter permease [Candidatus Caldarchaeum sp.]